MAQLSKAVSEKYADVWEAAKSKIHDKWRGKVSADELNRMVFEEYMKERNKTQGSKAGDSRWYSGAPTKVVKNLPITLAKTGAFYALSMAGAPVAVTAGVAYIVASAVMKHAQKYDEAMAKGDTEAAKAAVLDMQTEIAIETTFLLFSYCGPDVGGILAENVLPDILRSAGEAMGYQGSIATHVVKTTVYGIKTQYMASPSSSAGAQKERNLKEKMTKLLDTAKHMATSEEGARMAVDTALILGVSLAQHHMGPGDMVESDLTREIIQNLGGSGTGGFTGEMVGAIQKDMLASLGENELAQDMREVVQGINKSGGSTFALGMAVGATGGLLMHTAGGVSTASTGLFMTGVTAASIGAAAWKTANPDAQLPFASQTADRFSRLMQEYAPDTVDDIMSSRAYRFSG
ncbi:MAG: hypothetical protein HN423_07880, partial [Alphaproteobacteria bacterium]|nr:hypothetical protein [Alphaproteobacteria bacterium]